MEPPTIETHRLCLKGFTNQDADALHEIISRNGVLRYFPVTEPPLSKSVRAFHVDEQCELWSQRGYGLWAVVLKGTGSFIGRCGLQYLPETDEVEVDYILDPAVWGQGFATEAAGAALAFGFEQHGFNEIVGIVHPDNISSRRVLEKIGMIQQSKARYFGMDVIRYVAVKTD